VDRHGPINVLSLFSGAGGLDLGVAEALASAGRTARVVCYVEGDAFATAVLAARMADGRLDAAPVWSDVRTFDGRRWRGVVDIVAGGFPCQDISVAGSGAGIDGERSGLWRDFARIVRETGPRLVFVENVRALTRRGLGVVLGDLADLGFDAEWGCFSAAEVGAPHRRERIFILAHSDAPGLRELGTAHDNHGRDASRNDANRCRQGVFPPSPDDADGWREFLDAFPDAEPAICRDVDGVARRSHERLQLSLVVERSRESSQCVGDRVDRLRVCGNGVVPQTAALAFIELAARIGV
jgi:DNA (cytosine-5)-methyltransferase 1